MDIKKCINFIKEKHKDQKRKQGTPYYTHPLAVCNMLKEENQYGPEVQALELTLMNEANVPINKAQKVTYGLTNGEIDLSEGYIAKLQERVSKNLEGFIKDMKKEIIKQKLIIKIKKV